MALLEVTDLVGGYGHLPVLHGISLSIEEGETAVILGLNGAGKTTTLLNVAGLMDSWGGTVTFAEEDVTGWDSSELVEVGIVLVPEGRHVFPALSVVKNLRMGAWTRRHDAAYVRDQMEKVFEYFPRLEERAHQLGGTLSGGEQQMLAIGRGLMADPKLLLIDEASLGLSPLLAQTVFEIVSQINRDGVTVLMVEQNTGVLTIASRTYILEKGSVIYSGSGEQILEQEELRKAYLGVPA